MGRLVRTGRPSTVCRPARVRRLLQELEERRRDDGSGHHTSTDRSVRNRRWFALGALALAVLAVGVDGTVLSVALPTLSKALHASESDLQWFSSGYFLVLAAAMLPAGLLGDRYGRKKVLLVSLALFGVGSAGVPIRSQWASSWPPGCSLASPAPG
jgi:Na+/melibiose symporter-like transporter